MSTDDVVGALVMAALVLLPLVVGLVAALLVDGWQKRRQGLGHGEHPTGVWDEVDALLLQRERKRQVVKKIRAVARKHFRPATWQAGTASSKTDNVWR